jgi:dynein heavy chain
MIYLDPRNLGYQPYFEKWLTKWTCLKDGGVFLIETFNDLFAKYIPPIMTFIFEGIDDDI